MTFPWAEPLSYTHQCSSDNVPMLAVSAQPIRVCKAGLPIDDRVYLRTLVPYRRTMAGHLDSSFATFMVAV